MRLKLMILSAFIGAFGLAGWALATGSGAAAAERATAVAAEEEGRSTGAVEEERPTRAERPTRVPVMRAPNSTAVFLRSVSELAGTRGSRRPC
jgi:hypothetical protein